MSDSYELHLLRHAVSLVLHHDAITGTSQQHVVNDFISILSDAVEVCTKKISQYLSILTPSWGGSRRPKGSQQFLVCHMLNISQCRFSETQDSILLLVYNPLSIKTYHHVRLPAIALQYTIRDYNDDEVEHQLIPLPAAVINLPGRKSTAIQELCFEAENIPPLGFTSYYITPIRDPLADGAYIKKVKANPEGQQEMVSTISNEFIKLSIDKTTGLLESLQHEDGTKIMVSQNFYVYTQLQQPLQSGAYSFRPNKERPVPITDKVTYHTIKGTIVKEIRQKFSDWISQTIRLYRGEEFVELEWVVGPVPIGTDLGKEVVTIFKTNISHNGYFYTDSNGRQMIRRTCINETTSVPQKKALCSCFYPVTSRICISSVNTSSQMCVLTDRSQGGTSYDDGDIELMIHRRLLTDDGFGLEEPLNEEEFGLGLVVKGKHRIYFGNARKDIEDLSFNERATQMSSKMMFEPMLFLTSGEKINRRKWQNVRNKRFSPLQLHGLPRHINIITLEPWKAGSVLLRLENTLERPKGRKPDKDILEEYADYHINVDLRKIFLQLKIKVVRETTLAANQWLEEARQMDWSTRYVYDGSEDGILPEDSPDYTDNSKLQRNHKDYGQLSEEDEVIPKRRQKKINVAQRHPTKVKMEYYDRKKREANISSYVVSDNETHYEKSIGNANLKKLNVPTTLRPSFNNKRNIQRHTKRISTDITPRKPQINSDNYDDVTVNVHSPKPFSGAYEEADITASDDDGITKSIYEMYYKNQPRRIMIRPKDESSEEYPRRPVEQKRRTINTQMKYPELHRKEKRSFGNMRRRNSSRRPKGRGSQFSIKNANKKLYESKDIYDKSDEISRRYREDIHPNKERTRRDFKSLKSEKEYSSEEKSPDEEYEDDECSDETIGVSPGVSRTKRAVKDSDGSGEENQNEIEYIISLRPTQIRTFIIWFEDKKGFNI
ncbi:lysosomal alpha-mannosidase-like isoform X3 [Leptidea sinapis]|nr:lysosomal alpha-mannosidase-like isoform X3 [Leptidea sinapis]